ncbi:PREDICTED: uncharacterized protein LOC105457806 [Wasmannia auropunctata]|uniref:uncharacterized protein LOC105457806 n=1 Tax=Wasmannia auropunctata TaxID=64793 RepID=UPI0005F069BD|nr:PREDICTED: uncharacterized protein LOC105457806 [Wasmannia auropunctata]
MPSCFIKNCKSHTNYVFNKCVKYFSFPQDPELRLKWLEACRRDGNFKVTHERVCEIHFSSDCIEYRTSKPRSAHISPKIVRTLKKGSVPTELLDLPNKKRKLLHSFESTCNVDAGPSQKSVCQCTIQYWNTNIRRTD